MEGERRGGEVEKWRGHCERMEEMKGNREELEKQERVLITVVQELR